MGVMKIIQGFSYPAKLKNAYLTIGVYDGVHKGHSYVLSTLVKDAVKGNGKSVVVTFHPHPLRVLMPEFAPPHITSTGHKMRLLEQLGIDYCFVINFDTVFSKISPESFLNDYLIKHFDIKEICVGYDSAFGHEKQGNLDLLISLGKKHNFIVNHIPPLEIDGVIVSSTHIRKLIIAGEFELVELMLGRPYSLFGTVVQGDTIGREIGYPTANIDPHHEAIPPSGVYVVKVFLNTKKYVGILNIGYKPTFKEKNNFIETIEVHILDFNIDIYGKDIEIVFLKKLRDERRFASTKQLIEQIKIDEQNARKIIFANPFKYDCF